MAYPVVHFEVTGKDIGKLKSFYGGVFDWQFQDFAEPGMPAYAIVEKAEGGIGGGIGENPERRGPRHLLRRRPRPAGDARQGGLEGRHRRHAGDRAAHGHAGPVQRP